MNIVIFGAGGQAKETIDLIEENIEGKIVGLVDKNNSRQKILGYKLVGTDKEISSIIKRYKVTHFFVAIGDIKTRSKIYLSVKKKLEPINVISKKASISKHAIYGEHIIIYPGVVVSADVSIGNNVIINSNASIGHETIVSDHVNINPSASIAGKVIIKKFSTIGIGASIKENLTIARNTTVGGGAMVVKNTRNDVVYTGIPAKALKR